MPNTATNSAGHMSSANLTSTAFGTT